MPLKQSGTACNHNSLSRGCSKKCRFNSGPWLSMNLKITEEPAAVRLRHTIRPSIWRRLSLLEKIAVVQLVMGGCTFLLLVLLVAGS